MKKLWGSAAMIAATILWGTAFSAQSSGMRFMDPISFTALRSVIAAAALLLLLLCMDRIFLKRLTLWGNARSPEAKKNLLCGGFWCGVILAAASVTQQIGLKYTSAGKTGFLTALYIIIVPVIGIFLKKKTGRMLWLSVLLALAGSYLLCGGTDSIGKGELFVIVCAFIYSLHIMVIDKYAAGCDCVRLSCIQFAVAAPLAAAASLAAGEPWVLSDIVSALPFLAYCGVGSGAVAFTLQMISQKYLHPVTATLLMSLESVFAVLGGWLFLNEKLLPRELAGCAVIFAAIIISQLKFSSGSQKIPVEENFSG